MDLKISNRKVFQNNFIRNSIRELKHLGISKKLILQLISVAQSSNPTINNSKGRYSKLKVEDFTKELKITESKEVKKTLEFLCTPYDSMYGKNNHLFTKLNNYYIWNGNRNSNWSKFGYQLPIIFDVNMTSEIRQQIKEPELIFTTVAIALATQGGIPFTENQVRNSTGLTIYDIKKACKILGMKIVSVQSESCNFENKAYDIKSQLLFRGYVFTKESIEIAEKIVELTKMRLFFNNLFALRVFFYSNKQHINKSTFNNYSISNEFLKTDVKCLKKYEDYKGMCEKQNAVNAICLYKNSSAESNKIGDEKSFRFKTNFLNGSKAGKKGLKDSEVVITKSSPVIIRDIELVNNELSILLCQSDYASFADEVRKLYEKRKKERKTVKCCKELITEILDFIKDSPLCYKEHVIKHLMSINSIYDAWKSPMFSNRYGENLSKDEITIELTIEESQLNVKPKLDRKIWEETLRNAIKLCKEKGDVEYQSQLPDILSLHEYSEAQRYELKTIIRRNLLSKRELDDLRMVEDVRAMEKRRSENVDLGSFLQK